MASPPVAAANCSARAWAVSSCLADADRVRLAASRAVMAEARRDMARPWSRMRPVIQPVVRATAKNTTKVSRSVGWPMANDRRGPRKKKL